MKFEYFNPNPEAQTFKSGKPKGWYRDDSCVRALCCATGKDWTTIFNDLTKISGNFHDMPHSKNVIHEYCESHKFEHITFGKPAIGEKRPTIEQFIENNKIGTYILYTRDYYLCVKDGVLYNTSEMKENSIYSYWKLTK